MKKLFRWLAWICITLLLITTAGWFVMKPYLKDFLMQRLQKELQVTFGQYYHLEFTSFETIITNRSFSIRFYQPEFTTDTTQLEELKKFPPVYFKADSFVVSGINIRKLLLGSALDLENIELHNPDLVVLITKTANNSTDSSTNKKKNWNRKLITDVLLSKLAISKGNISLIQYANPADTFYYGDEINFELTGLHIPTQSPEGIYAASRFDNLKFSMSNVHFSPDRLYYEYSMKSINIDLKQDVFECRNLDLLPDKTLKKLSQDAAYQKTFAQISLGKLSLFGFDYRKLMDKELHIRSIHLDSASISLFRNKEKRLNKTLVKQSLQSALRQIPLDLKIDTILIQNMGLSVDILFPKHSDPAQIKLTGINGTLTRINTLNGSKKAIRMSLKARIMKTGTLTFNASFPVHLETHSYQAQINTMPFNEWNEVISKIGNLHIEDGRINRIKLSGNCTSDENNGKIIFEYSNLKCAVLREHKSGTLKKSKLLSLGGNMLIRQHNPDKNETVPIERAVHYTRHQYQGQTALWIGGMLDGMLATIFNERVKGKIDEIKAKKQR